MTKLQAVAPLFARRARRALSAFDFKGRKLEQLTEIAEKERIPFEADREVDRIEASADRRN